MFYSFCRPLVRLFMKMLFRLRVEGVGHVPAEGPVILCSNHLSNLDPMTVACMLDRKVRFVAKAELFRIPLLNTVITALGAIPVKRGSVSRETIRATLEVLRAGEVICIFPQGTRSEDVGEGKKGAASFALKTGAAVIPVAISGYRLFRPTKVIYGEPVDLDVARNLPPGEGVDRVTEEIMTAIARLLDRARRTDQA